MWLGASVLTPPLNFMVRVVFKFGKIHLREGRALSVLATRWDVGCSLDTRWSNGESFDTRCSLAVCWFLVSR